MGRVVGYISNTLETRLTRLLELSESEAIDVNKLSYKDTLKYAILNDPFLDISSNGETTFNVKANSSEVIADAILKDFIIGNERIEQQYKNLTTLITQGKGYNPAWPLITAYYCAFFCAIDISKTLNRININFTPEEMSVIKLRAKGSIQGLKDATNFTGVVSPECTKIRFGSTGSKPHHYAWDNLYHCVIKEALRKHADWNELTTLKNILFGERNWELPSAVRNTWNYKNPFLFKQKGHDVGTEFTRIVGRLDSAEYWLSSNFTSNGVTYHAGSIALLCEMLYNASHTAYENVFGKKISI